MSLFERHAVGTEKITTRDNLVKLAGKFKGEGRKIGFTSGVFDLLHAGHVDYLREAKSFCDLLIVAVNSDKSVKEIKGEKRPLIPESERAKVVAALEAVDYVFIFDDPNNNTNIKLLKPDVYIKAGDYQKETLSSAPLVEEYGGEVKLIKLKHDISTSSIVETICERYGVLPVAEKLPPPEPRPAVFLDRDGTINTYVEYLHEPEKLELLPGTVEALKLLQQAGYRIVITTNQPGIGLGYFKKEDFFKVMKRLFTLVSKEGVLIDRVYYSPHTKAENSKWRKPETGMIEAAVKDLNIILKESFVIGDMTSDIKFGENAGCSTVLVKTGQAGTDGLYDVKPDFVADNLLEAARMITGGKIRPVTIRPEKSPVELKELENLGKFAGRVGHDFNNLLGSLQGCLDLMEHKLSSRFGNDNPCERQLRIMRSAVKKSVDLTTRIRGFVRPGPLSRSEVQVGQYLKDILETLSSSETIPFDYELIVEDDLMISIDQFPVTQMLTGICLNAVEAMADFEDRNLLIRAEKSRLPSAAGSEGEAALRISVIDHGVGIKSELKKKVQQPFFSTKNPGIGKGMGLSLAMADALMKKHGGALEVKSEEGVGTVVHLYFPL
ncbi:MAG: HAD-IIIA family hydrolase [Candidatus Dadabacteria bacterium]|nr:MAG: HAD-IIIA family hydrolase [Candidatus Dadabacteria bacterium]